MNSWVKNCFEGYCQFFLFCIAHTFALYIAQVLSTRLRICYISTALCFVGCQYPELYIFTRFPDCSLIIPFVFKRTQHIEYKKQKRNIYAVMYHTSPYQISHATILVCSTVVVVGGGQKYNRHYLFFLGNIFMWLAIMCDQNIGTNP